MKNRLKFLYKVLSEEAATFAVQTRSKFRQVNHITNNLSTIISSYLQFEELGLKDKAEDALPHALNALYLLDKYLYLLEKYPEFRKGELLSENGYFPDLRVDDKDSPARKLGLYASGIEQYIQELPKRLREIENRTYEI